MGDEKPIPKERRNNSPTYQKPPRPHFIDFNGNVKPQSHPPAQKSQRRAPQDPYYAPYVAHGNFTPTPRPAPYLHTADHDSNVPEDSLESGHGLQTGHQRDHDERPGMDEERVLPSRDTDTSSFSRSQGDEVLDIDTNSCNMLQYCTYVFLNSNPVTVTSRILPTPLAVSYVFYINWWILWINTGMDQNLFTITRNLKVCLFPELLSCHS